MIRTLTLTACDDATTGRVASREHVEEHVELSYVECMPIGTNACAVTIPHYETVPECFRVNYHNDTDDENGAACVDERDYPTYNLGDQFPHPR